jgi:hypothetical protein
MKRRGGNLEGQMPQLDLFEHKEQPGHENDKHD